MFALNFFTFICAVGFVAAKSAQQENATTPKFVFFLSDNKLYRIDLATNEQKLVNDNFVVDYELDDVNNRLFWLDRAGQLFVRHIDDAKSPDKFAFQYHSATSDSRMALDIVTDKFYIIDGVSQEVDVIDARGKNQTILFERNPVLEEHVIREKPKRIALDPYTGLMFILTDLNGVKNLYRSNMDGSSKKLLITNVGGDELAIDHENRQLFWANVDQKAIESANFDGNNRAHVAQIQSKVSLTAYNNHLFWTPNEIGPNAKNIVNHCKIRENTCEESSILQSKLDKVYQRVDSLKIVRPSIQKFVNPCDPNNAGCQHLCLLTSSIKKFTCVCNTGWQPVDKDTKMCQQKVDEERRRRVKRNWWMYSTYSTARTEPTPGINFFTSLPIHILGFGKK